MDSEANRLFSVNDAGHDYELHNLEGAEVQNLKFIKKEKSEETGEFETVQNGTTNEAVLEVLIHRMKVLNEKMHSPFNDEAIAHLEGALKALNARTAEREDRGVEGTPEA